MILTTTTFKAMGFRIATGTNGVAEATLSLAIEQAEASIAQKILGNNYKTLTQMEATAPEIAGGWIGDQYVSGARMAIGHIAYACLLRMNINATTFGSVQKTDEHSTNIDPFEAGKYFEDLGRAMLHSLCKAKAWTAHECATSYTFGV